jgi:hypothetical protein
VSDEVLSIDPDRYKTNADIILACAEMGYLLEPVLDMTYGKGRFWKKYRPTTLYTNDNNRLLGAEYAHDFRFLPRNWAGAFKATVFDPPYKLDGTPGQGGPAEANPLYGVGADMREYESVDAVDQLYHDGLAEAFRVTGRQGFIIVKVMDQVSGMRTRWESWSVANLMRELGCRYVTTFFLLGSRKQPSGTEEKPRTQRNPRNNYSQMMVFRKELG